MKPFSYHAPGSLAEALDLISRYGKEAAVLAGGTDLLVECKRELKSPHHIIDLKGISSLEGIRIDSQGSLHLGPLSSLDAVSRSPILENGWSLLAQGAAKVGSRQIRNRATIGGNVCHASPSGDTLPPLLCLEARFRVVGPRGERQIPVGEFFLGPGKSALGDDEILAEITLPPPPSGCRGIYKKFSLRRAMDLAVAGVAVLGTIDLRDGIFSHIRIALGAVGPTPIRAVQAEFRLQGARPDPELLREAARLARKEAAPISDLRGSEWYRGEMIEHLVQEAIREITSER